MLWQDKRQAHTQPGFRLRDKITEYMEKRKDKMLHTGTVTIPANPVGKQIVEPLDAKISQMLQEGD